MIRRARHGGKEIQKINLPRTRAAGMRRALESLGDAAELPRKTLQALRLGHVEKIALSDLASLILGFPFSLIPDKLYR